MCQSAISNGSDAVGHGVTLSFIQKTGLVRSGLTNFTLSTSLHHFDSFHVINSRPHRASGGDKDDDDDDGGGDGDGDGDGDGGDVHVCVDDGHGSSWFLQLKLDEWIISFEWMGLCCCLRMALWRWLARPPSLARPLIDQLPHFRASARQRLKRVASYGEKKK